MVALSTGHAGSLCTIHAGSAAEALRRLETLALMADVGLPLAAIRDQIADAIDLVVRQERAPDGARRVVEVAEVVRVAGGPAVRELFTLRGGRAIARAPLSDALAARLASGAPHAPFRSTPGDAMSPGASAPSPPALDGATAPSGVAAPSAAAPPSGAAAPHEFLPPEASR